MIPLILPQASCLIFNGALNKCYCFRHIRLKMRIIEEMR